MNRWEKKTSPIFFIVEYLSLNGDKYEDIN